MRNERGSALWILLAVIAVIAVVEGLFLIRMDRRIASLEDGTGAAAPGAVTPLALGEELRELEERVEDNATGVKYVRERLDKGTERLAEVERLADEAAVFAGGGAPGGGAAALPKKAIDEAVAKAVDAKLESLPRNEDGEWKPSMDELKNTLELSEEQTDQAERILDDGKHEVFQLASLKRADGTNKMDDLVQAMKEPDPEAAMKQWFMSLFTEKIPGRDEAYIAEVLRISERTKKSLSTVLDEKQGKRLSRLNLDYLGVKTSYDPFAEYIQESMR